MKITIMKSNLIDPNSYLLMFTGRGVMGIVNQNIVATPHDLQDLKLKISKAEEGCDPKVLAREKAIAVLENIAGYLEDRGIAKANIFDCNEKKGTTTWYDLEDMVANIITK